MKNKTNLFEKIVLAFSFLLLFLGLYIVQVELGIFKNTIGRATISDIGIGYTYITDEERERRERYDDCMKEADREIDGYIEELEDEYFLMAIKKIADELSIEMNPFIGHHKEIESDFWSQLIDAMIDQEIITNRDEYERYIRNIANDLTPNWKLDSIDVRREFLYGKCSREYFDSFD